MGTDTPSIILQMEQWTDGLNHAHKRGTDLPRSCKCLSLKPLTDNDVRNTRLPNLFFTILCSKPHFVADCLSNVNTAGPLRRPSPQMKLFFLGNNSNPAHLFKPFHIPVSLHALSSLYKHLPFTPFTLQQRFLQKPYKMLIAMFAFVLLWPATMFFLPFLPFFIPLFTFLYAFAHLKSPGSEKEQCNNKDEEVSVVARKNKDMVGKREFSGISGNKRTGAPPTRHKTSVPSADAPQPVRSATAQTPDIATKLVSNLRPDAPAFTPSKHRLRPDVPVFTPSKSRLRPDAPEFVPNKILSVPRSSTPHAFTTTQYTVTGVNSNSFVFCRSYPRAGPRKISTPHGDVEKCKKLGRQMGRTIVDLATRKQMSWNDAEQYRRRGTVPKPAVKFEDVFHEKA